MKVAICFSGHLRNFSNLLDNFKDKILALKDHHQIDLFFSVWDIYEPEYSWANQNKTTSNLINVEDILKLNPIKVEVENFNQIKEQFLLSSTQIKNIVKVNKIKGEVNNWRYEILGKEIENLLKI